jgi:hypothetical protein
VLPAQADHGDFVPDQRPVPEPAACPFQNSSSLSVPTQLSSLFQSPELFLSRSRLAAVICFHFQLPAALVSSDFVIVVKVPV